MITLPHLVEQIVEQRCVLFVGPDTAETAGGYRGLPTSWHLATKLAARCNYRGQYRPLPQIAQIYEHARGREDLVAYLRQELHDPSYRPLPIHELIARIPFRIIVQAGWDVLLEQALQSQNIPYQVVYTAKDIHYRAGDDRLQIYKPYGSLEHPDSLIITENDQLDMFHELQNLKDQLISLVSSYSLLMVGYAPDYDSVFLRIYHQISLAQGEHRPPDFVVESLSRPEDALQWEARGIQAITADPAAFLHQLAQQVAQRKGYDLVLPDLSVISQAPAVTPEDQTTQTATFNRVLETFGVADLIEQSDIPLFTASQARDLDVMREAYERLMAGSSGTTADAAQVWLRQGNIEYARQNYQNARRYYHQALVARPTLAEAHHNLHYVALAENELDESLQAYQQAIALDPGLAFVPAQYHIDAVLGRGGMGVVYKAFDQITGQTVAIKMLDRAHLRTERLMARFQREAAILKQLEHPHIVRYLDFQHYQGRMFLVLEYLGQQTLAQRLAAEGPLPLDEAHAFFQQAGQCLSFVHEHHIIHRDIKPANIFLVDGQVKLIDFGLAADLEAGQPSVIGLATGTVAYMAPEQITGGLVDERTDIYALATLFYEMITGHHPGQGAYRPPSELMPGLNDALDIVLQKARERLPTDRYPTMAAFCQEMARVIPLQPASSESGPVRQQLARWEQFLQTYRPWLFAAAILAWLLIPDVRILGGENECFQISAGGILMWDAMFLSFLAGMFTVRLARRSGYASPFAYSTLLGALAGIFVGLVVSLMITETGMPAWANPDEAFFLLLTHTMMLTIVGMFTWLLVTVGTALAMRRQLSPWLFTRISYGLVILAIGLYALFLYLFVCGIG
jgi:eukaryotic-like serine/threonine-protein kinase